MDVSLCVHAEDTAIAVNVLKKTLTMQHVVWKQEQGRQLIAGGNLLNEHIFPDINITAVSRSHEASWLSGL